MLGSCHIGISASMPRRGYQGTRRNQRWAGERALVVVIHRPNRYPDKLRARWLVGGLIGEIFWGRV